MVWDGAAYHRSGLVKEAAARFAIELEPLPGYSPDFMPVEALWRWLREDVTYNRCHTTRDELITNVRSFEAAINRDPIALADRLWVKDTLDPEEVARARSASVRSRRWPYPATPQWPYPATSGVPSRAMESPSKPPRASRVWDDPRIVAPDAETWSQMSQVERDASVERVLAVLDEYREAMSEGVRHFRAKSGAAADLDGHFRRAGREVFLACELAVLYPKEAVIVPDVLAVMDCDPDLDVDSWVVADRGRGIDLVLEVRNTGKKHKDLVENVADYARLRIPEYFSFDCRSRVLRGWHLASSGARSYRPVLPQGGYLASSVLGLDLAVVDGRLRFFANQALVPTADELVARLQEMADRNQRAAAESEQAAVESEQAAVESRRAAAEATDRAARSQAALGGAILRLCERQGLALDDRQRAMVIAEADPEQLARWLDRCLGAVTPDEVFSDG